MRLKSYIAPTMPEAMRSIRRELGRDAVIIASHPVDDGIRVTAAIECLAGETGTGDAAEAKSAIPAIGIAALLDRSGIPARLGDAITRRADGVIGPPERALADGLDKNVDFTRLEPTGKQTLLLIGPLGAGKTVAAAKLAVSARLAGTAVNLIAANPDQAGALNRLQMLVAALALKVRPAPDRAKLRAALEACQSAESLTLIDGPAINPYDVADAARLGQIVDEASIDPILVFPAGSDAEEAATIGATFAALVVRRMIVSKLDATRRYGAPLAAAQGGDIALSAASASPYVGEALLPLTAAGLARLLCHDTETLNMNSLVDGISS